MNKSCLLVISEEREKDVGDDAKELEAIEEGISFKSVFDHMNITKPSSLKGKSVGKYLEDIQWTEEMGKQLENFWKQGKHYQFCSKPGLKRVVLDVSYAGKTYCQKIILCKFPKRLLK